MPSELKVGSTARKFMDYKATLDRVRNHADRDSFAIVQVPEDGPEEPQSVDNRRKNETAGASLQPSPDPISFSINTTDIDYHEK